MKLQRKDFDTVAQYIQDEYNRRKKDRSELEKQWAEIDRQLKMKPDRSRKINIQTGTDDPNKSWFPEVELPLQSEALETLTADAKGMQFPTGRSWFKPHSNLTDEYLSRVEFKSLISGDENEVPTKINQDNADQLVTGYLSNFHRQYDFRGNVDLINSEAFKYSVGIGRVRVITKDIFADTERGMVKKSQKFPVLIPRSIKETYLDDREHIMMQEGFMVAPLTIFTRAMSYEDLKANAKGSQDPTGDGGWVPSGVRKLEPDDNGFVNLLEAEGHIIVHRSRDTIDLPNVVVTIGVGKNAPRVIRWRFLKHGYSLIQFPYHQEHIDSPYGSSPLMKGRPLQMYAVESLNGVLETGELTRQPPISYDRSDMWFAQAGGPVVEPGALWGTLGDVKVHQIGNPQIALVTYQEFLSQYADATAMHKAKLGAQTVSHTTAFAKNAELQRGSVRTVDYAKASLDDPLTRFLYMEYEIGRSIMRGTHSFYIDAYGGFVSITKDDLPDHVIFDVHGAGTPVEEAENQQKKISSLQFAMQIEQLNVQLGKQPKLDLGSMIEEVLREGGWTDLDPFILTEQPIQGGSDAGPTGEAVPPFFAG